MRSTNSGKIKLGKFITRTLFWTVCFLSALAAEATAQDGSKPKPEEIVAKHIGSIGAPEALAAAKTRMIQGKVQARVVQASLTNQQGKALLASAPDKTLLQMMFEVISPADYAREQVSFDGKKVNAPFITESQRSALGNFLFEYSEVVKQGLLGGSLISSWALLDAKNKIVRLKYDGQEKIGDRQTYVLRCYPRGGTALTVKLYFDAETFRHLRTTYYHQAMPSTIAADEGRLSETRYKLTEDFSDYKPISGLNLPTTYKITFIYENQRRQREFEWLLKFSRFAFNQQIPPDLFQ
jgi:hypothetical protein